MTFESYWDRKKQATPGLAEGGCSMVISVASFRAELEKAFEAGRKWSTHGKKVAEDFEKVGDRDYLAKFMDMFGMKK